MRTYTPRNLETLFRYLKEMTEKSKIVAGSTDFGIHLNKGWAEPDGLMYLGYIPETRQIIEHDSFISIGSYTTHTEIEESKILQKYCKALCDAAKDVGSLQIRNNGTIGGNIANASPAGDLIPVLFMLKAKVIIATKEGKLKEVEIENFILGPSKTILQYGEAILRFHIPKKKDFYSAFIKLGSRKKLTISRIGCTLGFILDGANMKEVNMYIGAISLKPVQFEKAEKVLEGKKLRYLIGEEGKRTISSLMSDLIFEITPEKFDRDYKMWASKAVIHDLFTLFEELIGEM